MNSEDKRKKRNAYMREYYQRNKKKINNRNKKYREKHKEKYREYNKKYKQENKERIQKLQKRWRDNNKDKIRKYHENYANSRPDKKPDLYYWNGSKSSKYRKKYKPDHPRATKKGYVPEHNLVMEKEINRYLRSGEVVHHKNGDGLDNRIDNLELITWGEHSKMHMPERDKDTGKFI